MRKTATFIALIVGVLLGFWFSRLLAQDACLDAGGSWDGRRAVCVGVDTSSP